MTKASWRVLVLEAVRRHEYDQLDDRLLDLLTALLEGQEIAKNTLREFLDIGIGATWKQISDEIEATK